MEPPSHGSVTRIIQGVQAGESVAAQELWNRYFARLVGLARVRLRGVRRVSDEEDVALSAMQSALIGIEKGRFPQLNDRTGLWPLLVTIVARKAKTQLRWAYAQRRSPNAEDHDADLPAVPAEEPTPDFALEVADEIDRLVRGTVDEAYRRLVQLKLEGYTNEEIAENMGVSTFTVYRKLRIMRREWEEAELS